ncbi:MAG TPA: mechanosensitive ion channel family protein [Pseudolysinimonas sp.]|nr:mechanosensitive ion channel family protein [Pseudolysinimonas sp.]
MADLLLAQNSWPALAIAVGLAVTVGILLVAVVSLITRAAARRLGAGDQLRRVRLPFRVLVILVLVWIAVSVTLPEPSWRPAVDQTFRILTIAVGAAFAGALIGLLLTHTMNRYRVDVADNRIARRARTQLAIIRRLVYLAVSMVALGAILLTFPGVEAVGASVLASAGLLSVIAGLAAQSTLANVFAGVQLAFSDAIRVDDVVVVDEEWGRIEEITLMYIVLRLWDDRRLVLPSTYFATKPFENWTRHQSELLGAVEFDLDWRVSPAQMREELDRVLAGTTLWDGRAKVLQVTDAVGGLVRIRILVTAHDAPTLFDLRCYVREEFVEWMRREAPQALPRQRVELAADASATESKDPRSSATTPRAHMPHTDTDREGLFTGSREAEQRAQTFTASVELPTPPRL